VNFVKTSGINLWVWQRKAKRGRSCVQLYTELHNYPRRLVESKGGEQIVWTWWMKLSQP